MLDIAIVGPILILLVLADILLHIYLDYQKLRARAFSTTQDSEVNVPRLALFAAASTTMGSFILIFLICFLVNVHHILKTLECFFQK